MLPASKRNLFHLTMNKSFLLLSAEVVPNASKEAAWAVLRASAKKCLLLLQIMIASLHRLNVASVVAPNASREVVWVARRASKRSQLQHQKAIASLRHLSVRVEATVRRDMQV